MTDPAPTAAETRAAQWLAAWDSQGYHRTGSDGDLAGATWLAAEVAALGGAVEIEEFELDRLDPLDVFLELAGERLTGVPLFDAPPTPDDGVSGRLGPIGSGAEIGVVELPPRAVYSGEYRELQRRRGHRGLVVVCAGDEPGLGLLNAEGFRERYEMPALHLSSDVRERILAAATRGDAARLVSTHRRVPARACNVVVRFPGRDAGGPKLVVTTPRSSWWQSTAERGGGIICWLEALRALLARSPDVGVTFAALSGHELNHLGFDDFLARRPGLDRPPEQGGAIWMHCGANLGAIGSELSVLSPSDDLRALAVAALNRSGHPPDDVPPGAVMPNGETRDIHRAGGTHLTLVGTNRWFHLPQDRWPGTVDLPALARIAAGAAEIAAALSRG